MSTICMPGGHRRQKMLPLELEFQTIVSYHMSAGNQTQVFWESSKFSLTLVISPPSMLSYIFYLKFDYHFINFVLTIALEPHFEDEDIYLLIAFTSPITSTSWGHLYFHIVRLLFQDLIIHLLLLKTCFWLGLDLEVEALSEACLRLLLIYSWCFPLAFFMLLVTSLVYSAASPLFPLVHFFRAIPWCLCFRIWKD